MAPDERRMTEGPLAFVDCDADNLRPGSLLGLRRRAPSFGGKGRRAVVESRDGQTLAALRRVNVANARPNNQTVANVYPILTWVRLARRIPVCIHIDETPPSVVLAAGITAAVEIEHRARTE
jgi:hypothetical protein